MKIYDFSELFIKSDDGEYLFYPYAAGKGYKVLSFNNKNEILEALNGYNKVLFFFMCSFYSIALVGAHFNIPFLYILMLLIFWPLSQEIYYRHKLYPIIQKFERAPKIGLTKSIVLNVKEMSIGFYLLHFVLFVIVNVFIFNTDFQVDRAMLLAMLVCMFCIIIKLKTKSMNSQ